ncbi:MAG: hypothetical protein WAO98_09025 [Alphaproteobacteria bacterium]
MKKKIALNFEIPAWLSNPRLLLPVMICVGLLITGIRVTDVVDSFASGRFFARSALAEDKKAEAKPEAKTEEKAEDKKAEAKPATSPSPDGERTDKAALAEDDLSPAEMEVLKQLSGRREELEKRSRDMDTREALMKVAEQRVDQKIKELETLRTQLQSMVGQASEAQAAQTENLVKIYETMKPEEAAKIFEALDMPVLLGVIQKMKPARTAPILAKMPAEKAKEITIALTKRDQLPQVK